MPSLGKFLGLKPRKKDASLLSPDDAASGRSRASSVARSDISSVGSIASEQNSINEAEIATAPIETAGNTGQARASSSECQPAAPKSSLWEQAYEKLQLESPSLIREYEKLLSNHLSLDLEMSDNGETSVNQQEMLQIAKQGLDRLSNSRLRYTIAGTEFVVVEQVAEVSKALVKFQDYIGEAMKASPQASMAWAGVCVVLPLFTNPSTAETANKEGFTYVTSRMSFFSGLEPLLWPQRIKLRQDLRAELEGGLVNLYKATIAFHVESALRFYRNWFSRTARDMAKFEDWEALLKAVKDAECIVRVDSSAINDSAMVAGIAELNNVAEKLLQGLQTQISIATQQLEATKEHVLVSKQQLEISKRQLDAMNQLTSSLSVNNVPLNAHIIHEAQYASADTANGPKCLENTRTSIRKRIMDWANAGSGPNILWLNGPAGTGKSTLARTLAEDLDKQSSLAGGYFFKRGNQQRNRMSRVLATLADQTARRLHGFKACICASLASIDKDAFDSMSYEFQFEKLFETPLQALQATSDDYQTLVVVIDALDESIEQQYAFKMLCVLSKLGQTQPRFNILVTSRATAQLEEQFEALTDSGIEYETLRLQHEFADETKQDIEKYMRTRFTQIRKYKKVKRDPWPREDEIQLLLSRATDPSPLFVYASSLFRFLEGSSPTKQLEKWLQVSSTSSGQLQEIYQPILADAFLRFDDEERQDAEAILQAVIVAATPLSALSLSELLNIELDDVHQVLRQFHAVILQSENSRELISLHHKSFSDCLLSEPASSLEGKDYRIDSTAAHSLLAYKCLKSMNEHLKRDLLGLDDFTLSKTTATQEQLETIAASLEYACKQWTLHLHCAQLSAVGAKAVEDFLKEHFLHWLECLVWVDGFGQAFYYMVSLEKTAMHLDPSSFLLSLARDARRFLPALNDFIFDSPLQLYSTGLLFAPTSSFVRNEFWHQRSAEISSIDGIQPEWDSTLHLLEAPSDPDILTFSPNGLLLAAICDGNEIVIWDSVSGIVLTEISVSDRVEAAVFSPDSTTLAALTASGTMQFWDAYSGLIKRTLPCCPNLLMPFNSFESAKGLTTQSLQFPDDGLAWDVVKWQATHIVPRLAREGMTDVQNEYMDKAKHTEDWFQVFSEGGALVASPTADRCIMVWNSHTGKLKAKLQRHKYPINALLISPNLSTIASTGFLTQKDSISTEAYMWDIESGNKSADLNRADSFRFIWTKQMQYTKDSRSIILERVDGVRLWNIASAQITHTVPDGIGTHVQAMTCKEDRLAYKVDGYRVRISMLPWTEPNVEQDGVKRVDGHDIQPARVFDVNMSSRGIIALKDDGRLEFRDLTTNKTLAEYTKNHSVPATVTFSEDGQRVMHTENEGTIVVRETTHFSQLFTSTLHTSPEHMGLDVLGIGFSPNGKLLAFSSRSLPFTIWDIESGMILACLEDGDNHIENCGFHPHANEVVCCNRVHFDCPEDPLGWSSRGSLTYFDIEDGSMLERWHIANYQLQCFVSDGSRLLAYPSHHGRMEDALDILCVKTGSRLIQVAAVGNEFQYWSPVTYGMLPIHKCQYVRGKIGYMDVDTGQVVDNPPITLDPEIRYSNSWVLYNGKRILYIPHAFQGYNFSVLQWKETAVFIGKSRLVQLLIRAPDKE